MKTGNMIGRGRTAEVYEWGADCVVKLFYSTQSPEWIEREAEVGRQVANTGLRVPEVYDMVDIDNRKGIVYERMEGRSMLGMIQAKPWNIPGYARLMAKLHADMHSRSGFAGLPAQKEIMTEAIMNSRELLGGERISRICGKLKKLPEGQAVCHGDFHPDNILLQGQTAAIIDWTNVYAGNPLGDAARTCIMMASPYIPPGSPAPLVPLMKIAKGSLLKNYRSVYAKLAAAEGDAIELWMLPVAAARLRENVPGEREWLLDLIDRKLASDG